MFATKQQRFKKSICIAFALLTVWSTQLKAQYNQGNCPNNIDFEYGDFTNWSVATGLFSAGPSYNWSGFSIAPSVHTILTSAVNGGQTDQYGGFPVMCPNGSGTSVKLGNNSITSAKAQRLRYTFVVPASSTRYNLTYYYAAVLSQGPTGSHTPQNQARFTVSLQT